MRQANCGPRANSGKPTAASQQREGSGKADSGPKANCGKADCPEGSVKPIAAQRPAAARLLPVGSGKADSGPKAKCSKADSLFELEFGLGAWLSVAEASRLDQQSPGRMATRVAEANNRETTITLGARRPAWPKPPSPWARGLRVAEAISVSHNHLWSAAYAQPKPRW